MNENSAPSQAELQIILRLYEHTKFDDRELDKALRDIDQELAATHSTFKALDVLQFMSEQTMELIINAKALKLCQMNTNKDVLTTTNNEEAQTNLMEIDDVNAEVLDKTSSIDIEKDINENTSIVSHEQHNQASSSKKNHTRKRQNNSISMESIDHSWTMERPKRKSARVATKINRQMFGLPCTESPEKKENIDKEKLKIEEKVKRQRIMSSDEESGDEKPSLNGNKDDSNSEHIPDLETEEVGEKKTNSLADNDYSFDDDKKEKDSDSSSHYIPDLSTDEEDVITKKANSSNAETRVPIVRRRPPQTAGTANQPDEIVLDSGDEDTDVTNNPRISTKVTITADNDRIEIRRFCGVFEKNKDKECTSCNAKADLNRDNVCKVCYSKAVKYAETEFQKGRIRLLEAYKQWFDRPK